MRRHETVSICFNQGVFLSQILQVDPMMNCPCTPDLDLDEIGQVHQGSFQKSRYEFYGIKVCRHWFLLVGYWKGSKRTADIQASTNPGRDSKMLDRMWYWWYGRGKWWSNNGSMHTGHTDSIDTTNLPGKAVCGSPQLLRVSNGRQGVPQKRSNMVLYWL